jgi:YD repeat-containing protein
MGRAAAGQSSPAYETVTYSYDGAGNVAKVTTPAASTGGPAQVTVSTYSAASQLVIADHGGLLPVGVRRQARSGFRRTRPGGEPRARTSQQTWRALRCRWPRPSSLRSAGPGRRATRSRRGR